jgi:hypothetical protein
VIDGVGNVPISPLRVVFPVLVILPPASTAKELAVPRGTGAVAAWALVGIATRRPSPATDAIPKRRFRECSKFGGNFMLRSFVGPSSGNSHRIVTVAGMSLYPY